MMVAEQLALDFPAPDDLSDLDWDGAERLVAAARDADFGTRPAPPACVCFGGSLLFRDEWSEARCLRCGRWPQ